MTETFAQWEHIRLSSQGMRWQYYKTAVARGAVDLLCYVFSSLLCSALYLPGKQVSLGKCRGWAIPRDTCFAKYALEQQ